MVKYGSKNREEEMSDGGFVDVGFGDVGCRIFWRRMPGLTIWVEKPIVLEDADKAKMYFRLLNVEV